MDTTRTALAPGELLAHARNELNRQRDRDRQDGYVADAERLDAIGVRLAALGDVLREFTLEDVAALHILLRVARDVEDEGPRDESWQSLELLGALSDTEELVARLERLLSGGVASPLVRPRVQPRDLFGRPEQVDRPQHRPRERVAE